MSEYLPLEKSTNRAKPARTETAQRQADISTPARQPQRAAVTPAVRPAPGTVPFSPLASLQRMLANRQIQAKLTLGPVGDQYEQEADAVAQQVVSRLSTSGETANQAADQPSAQRQEEEEMQMKPISTLQRQEEEEEEMQPKRLDTLQRQEEEEMQMKPIDSLQRQDEEEEMQMKPIDSIQRQDEEEEMQMKPISTLQRQDEEEEMQMKPISTLQRQDEEEEMAQPKRLDTLQRQEVLGADGGAIAPELEQSIQGARSGGQPIADTLRAPMENAFGADFSGVRVHSDSQSDALNQSIQARAFTTGQDVFFRQGEYNPGSSQGQELLAHELTHVVQQNGSAVQQKREE